MDNTQEKIKKFLEDYNQNIDGIWGVKTTPGYYQQLDWESAKVLTFLKGLLDG